METNGIQATALLRVAGAMARVLAASVNGRWLDSRGLPAAGSVEMMALARETENLTNALRTVLTKDYVHRTLDRLKGET